MKTYRIDKRNKTVILKFSKNEEIRKEIKSCSRDAHFNSALQHWVVPITTYSQPHILELIKYHKFQHSPSEAQLFKQYDYSVTDQIFSRLEQICEARKFTYIPRKYQIESLAYAMKQHSFINGDDVGLGKCESINNRVFVPGGRKRIGELVVGESIIGSAGLPIKVTAIHPQQQLKKLYTITFSDGSSVVVSNDHLFSVRSSNISTKKYHTLTIDQLLDKDLTIQTKGVGRNQDKIYQTNCYYKTKGGGNKWQIPIVDPIVFDDRPKQMISAYTLGVLLGDGHCTKSGTYYLEVHKEDFEELLKECPYEEIQSINNKRRASIKSFKKYFKDNELDYKLSSEKFIPNHFKYGSIEDRLSLLQGLLDTDGCCVESTKQRSSIVSYYTTSRRLGEDVIEIVQSLGGTATKTSRLGSYKNAQGEMVICKKFYTINIKLPIQFVPFRLKRKVALFKLSKKYCISRYIKKIEFKEYGEAVCISVDAEDRLYVTENAIVTHNTFEAIIYTEALRAFPCLVVTPASVKYNWAEKWQEIVGPTRTISVIESANKNNNWDADVVIINYDILGKKVGKGASVRFEQLLTRDWKMFTFDEGHFMKNDSSQRSKAAKMILKKNSSPVQLLTGTVAMSRPVEIWNLLVLIKKHKLISKDFHTFALTYCGAYKSKFGWVYDGATNMFELNERLRKLCYLRREKRDVLKELPDIEKVIIKMSITNSRDIKRATENMIQYIRETKGDESAEKAMEAEQLVGLSVLRKLAIEGKTKAIEQYLSDWKVGGKKLLVFGLHKEALELFAEKFKCPLIAGGVSSKNKQKIVNDWKKSEDVFLFANMQSAGTGIDGLQEVCSNMLIIELPWRPSDLTQVIARVDRSGQYEPSTVRFMLNFDTIDIDMWEMLQEKESVVEAVNKGVDVDVQQSGMKMVLQKLLKRASKV